MCFIVAVKNSWLNLFLEYEFIEIHSLKNNMKQSG